MILSSIKSIKRYLPLSNPIRYCIEYYNKKDFSTMEKGTYQLEGGIALNINSYKTTISPDDLGFEAHRKMIDLQIVIKGREKCLVTTINKATTTKIYNSSKDIEWFNAAEYDSFILDTNNLVLFFPDDVHKPGLSIDNKQEDVTKIVFKIPAEKIFDF